MRTTLFAAILFSLFAFTSERKISIVEKPEDAILGDWMTVKNNLKVRVTKENGQYKATILWFNEVGYKCKMNECTDENNPDPALRNRKIIGLQVLSGLKYDAQDKYWKGGEIYDSNSGHTYDSAVRMPSQNVLDVRGFYLFEWLGQTLNFYRVK
ncbi:hypothetical protein BH09BAC5_BH09BAC5_09150 [soil metagenome]